MRKRFLSILLLPLLLLTGCNSSDEHYESKPIVTERSVGEIGDFDLLGPENGFNTDHGFTFTWEEASNADYYQLEICSNEEFSTLDPKEEYVKESNLSQNRFDLTYSLKKKDQDYFWRVTAINKDHRKMSNTHNQFHYNYANKGELPTEIEDAEHLVSLIVASDAKNRGVIGLDGPHIRISHEYFLRLTLQFQFG